MISEDCNLAEHQRPKWAGTGKWMLRDRTFSLPRLGQPDRGGIRNRAGGCFPSGTCSFELVPSAVQDRIGSNGMPWQTFFERGGYLTPAVPHARVAGFTRRC